MVTRYSLAESLNVGIYSKVDVMEYRVGALGANAATNSAIESLACLSGSPRILMAGVGRVRGVNGILGGFVMMFLDVVGDAETDDGSSDGPPRGRDPAESQAIDRPRLVSPRTTPHPTRVPLVLPSNPTSAVPVE